MNELHLAVIWHCSSATGKENGPYDNFRPTLFEKKTAEV